MKSKRFSRLPNILIKVLTIIILASLFGVKYIGLFSTKVNAEDGWFSFNNLFDNNPLFNLVGAQGQQNWLDLELDLDAEQVGDDVTLTATINTELPTGVNKKYYWYFSSDGGTNFYNCIGGGDMYTTTNTYQAAYSPGNIYKVVVYAEVRNSYSLIWDAYNRILGRKPDISGLNTWGQTLTQHTLIQEFADLTGVTPSNEISALGFALVISMEYLRKTDWNSNNAVPALITQLYTFALGREPSQNEINSWTVTYGNTSGSTNVPIDVYYTVPNGVFRLINGICGSTEAGNKHEERYYYDKSTGKYTYATATLTDVTTYVNEDTVSPSTLNINPNGGTMDVESPMGETEQNISSTTAYKQFAGSKLKIINASKSTTSTTQYTISYNGNNGTVGTLNSGNTSATITETINYDLSGWTKNPNPLNGTINSSNIYTFPSENENTDTITAEWTGSEPIIESTSITLPLATRAGYTLDGWYTAASGGISRGNAGETYKPTTSETLYAHWIANTATVTVRKDYSDWEEWESNGIKVALYQGGEEQYSYAAGSKSGATISWSEVREGTYNIYASKSALDTSTMVDTQDYLIVNGYNSESINYLSVKVHRGTGIESVSGGGPYLNLQNATIDATVKPGYTWKGWTNCDCGENNCFCDPCDCEIMTTEKLHTLPVQWEIINRTAEATLNTYTISYNLDGGSVAGTNPTSYTVEDNNITLINPTKAGYRFLGWTGTGLSANTMTVTIPHGSIGDRSYVAHWEANTATITIKRDNANWSNSGMKLALYQNGSITSFTDTNATKSGATVKWSGVPNGTYDIYASKSASSLNSLVDTGLDVVVTSSGTATIDYYTLTLQAGVGISAVSGGGTYLKNQQANIDATVTTGYTWQGWSVISGNSPY